MVFDNDFELSGLTRGVGTYRDYDAVQLREERSRESRDFTTWLHAERER